MSQPWLSIVGIGEDGIAGLSPIAKAAIDEAEILVGGERHLAMIPPDDRRRIVWASPIDKTVTEIALLAGKRIAVIASGDPMWFGIGATLRKTFASEGMRIVPSPSAFSLAAAKMGWALHEVECLTVHGRPLERIAAFLQPGARLLVLSHDGATPARAAAMLTGVGYGPSHLAALAHLGGEREEVVTATAETWGNRIVADLNTLAIECVAAPGAKVLARVPGLPDEAFTHDGQLTKRDIRAVTIAALAPMQGQHLWDLGAGCGSIAIEWLRAARGATAIAVERDAARCRLIADNALALGVPELAIVTGEAPSVCAALPKPDAVFIGGGTSDPGLVDAAWDALGSGGRLVANAVSLEAEAVLTRARQDRGGDLVRLEIAHAERLGGLTVWRPKLAVVQWRAVKP